VFGIPERNGKVKVEIVKGVSAEALLKRNHKESKERKLDIYR